MVCGCFFIADSWSSENENNACRVDLGSRSDGRAVPIGKAQAALPSTTDSLLSLAAFE
jgi:hypothetical protein